MKENRAGATVAGPSVMRIARLTVVCLSLLWLGCSSPSGITTDAGMGGGGTGGGMAAGGDPDAGGAPGGTGGHGGAGGGTGGHGDAGGGTGGAGGADAGTTDASRTSFSAVQPILMVACVRCHDPAHPVVPETVTFVTMNLTASGAYAALVNKPATAICGGTLVTPGDPTKSFLYAKITQDMPCFGDRMPHQGMIRTPPLADDQIAVFESWIRDGAKP